MINSGETQKLLTQKQNIEAYTMSLPIVKLTTRSGYTWQTNVSSQVAEAEVEKYFLGQYVDTSSDPEVEKMEVVTQVDFIPAGQQT